MIHSVKNGEYLSAIMALGLAACCCAIFGIWLTVGNPVPRGTFDSAGTTIRPDRRIELLMITVTLTGIFGMGMFGALQLTGKLDIPIRRDAYPLLAASLGAGAVILLLWLGWVIKRGGNSYLRLTVDGFEFASGFRSPKGKWHKVVAVTDEVPDKPKVWSPLVMVMADGTFRTLEAAGTYTPGGRALREMVRFYWQHPDYRFELTDGRALERLRNEEFEAV
ncbi:hypothetical protein BST20_17990 [Mycobacterium branderi]|nr:hypothetical protein BST20_17990 [Mycobacterium branderi]